MTDEQYMERCIQLAKQAAGNVAPNPMVGAVLVYSGRIIGEGFHQKYGEAHAEVNCINSVMKEDERLIEKSALYVSLEPCAHFGKTSPCSALIIRHKIKKVIIGCTDIFKEVSGKGIQQLKNAGIEVVTRVLEKECIELNKRFFTFHQKQRPYIILKWAQSANAKIGSKANERILISNDFTNRLAHCWRSEEAAILVGTNTALKDDPSLATRLWKGKNPLRVVIDKRFKLPSSLKIFDEEAGTVIFNSVKNDVRKSNRFIKLDDDDIVVSMLQSLYQLNIQSIIIEGGAKTLQSFIDARLWDEARIITSTKLNIQNGVDAPELKGGILHKQEIIFDDQVNYFKQKQQ